MSHGAPPTRAEKDSLVLHTVGGLVLGLDNLCLLAPDDAVALGPASEILLVVDETEDNVAGCTGSEEESSAKVGEGVRVVCKVLGLKGVDCRQPHHASPREVEAVVVVADVNGAKVPIPEVSAQP